MYDLKEVKIEMKKFLEWLLNEKNHLETLGLESQEIECTINQLQSHIKAINKILS